MAVKLSKGVRALFEGKNFAHLATLMKDGSPHVSPVWVDLEGDQVLVNTADGRVKVRNIRRDPRVALSIYDQSNPYRVAHIKGRVMRVRKEGADAHIDKLAKKYLGQDRYPWRGPGEQRLIVEIHPEKVATMGVD